MALEILCLAVATSFLALSRKLYVEASLTRTELNQRLYGTPRQPQVHRPFNKLKRILD